MAERHWKSRRAGARHADRGVFPFYLVHQTIIVLVAYWLIPARLARRCRICVLIASDDRGCWAFYAIGRRIAILRPLIGLRPLSSQKVAS